MSVLAGQPFNSGNVPHGSKVVTVFKATTGGAAPASPANWKLENITINRPTKKIARPDELGAPNGWAIVNDQVTMTAVAQVATAGDTDWPAPGLNFTDDFGYGSERFVVTDASVAMQMADYWKVNITCWKDDSGTGSDEAFT